MRAGSIHHSSSAAGPASCRRRADRARRCGERRLCGSPCRRRRPAAGLAGALGPHTAHDSLHLGARRRGGHRKLLRPQLSWMEAFLLGFALSPTDPVVTSSVVASTRVPQVVRHTSNLESGLNDGLALPFVLFFLAFAGDPQRSAVGSAGELAPKASSARRSAQRSLRPRDGCSICCRTGHSPNGRKGSTHSTSDSAPSALPPLPAGTG